MNDIKSRKKFRKKQLMTSIFKNGYITNMIKLVILDDNYRIIEGLLNDNYRLSEHYHF